MYNTNTVLSPPLYLEPRNMRLCLWLGLWSRTNEMDYTIEVSALGITALSIPSNKIWKIVKPLIIALHKSIGKAGIDHY